MPSRTGTGQAGRDRDGGARRTATLAGSGRVRRRAWSRLLSPAPGMSVLARDDRGRSTSWNSSEISRPRAWARRSMFSRLTLRGPHSMSKSKVRWIPARAASSSRVRPGASRRSVAAKRNCARMPGRAPSTWGPCRARCRLWAYRRWVMFAAAIGSRGCSPTGAPCYPDQSRVRLTGGGEEHLQYAARSSTAWQTHTGSGLPWSPRGSGFTSSPARGWFRRFFSCCWALR